MRLPGPLTQRKHSALEPFAVFTPGDKASKNLRFSGDQQQVLLTLVGLSGEEARKDMEDASFLGREQKQRQSYLT